MARAPIPGQVKSRLAPALSPEERASLARAMLVDTLSLAGRLAGPTVLAYTPASARELMESLAPEGAIVIPQVEGNLGVRQEAALEATFALGCTPVLIMGSDSPSVPLNYLRDAREALTRGGADLAVVSCSDGGYCVLGLNAPVPGLLAAVDWSVEQTWEQLVTRAQEIGLRCHRRYQWHDVDTPSDMERLAGEMRIDRTSPRRAPATHQWLYERGGGRRRA